MEQLASKWVMPRKIPQFTIMSKLWLTGWKLYTQLSRSIKGLPWKNHQNHFRRLEVINENFVRAKYLKRGWLIARPKGNSSQYEKPPSEWLLALTCACTTRHLCWPAHTRARSRKISKDLQRIFKSISKKLSKHPPKDVRYQKISKDHGFYHCY